MKRVKFPVNGANVAWDLGTCDRHKVLATFASLGLAHFAPKERGDAECLRAAVAEVAGGRNKLVQRLKSRKHGVELVQVERGETHNYYTSDFTARVENGQVVTGYGYADTAAIQKAFDHQKAILHAGSVGESLVSVAKNLHALPLLPRGGLYWMPEEGARVWEKLADGIEQAAEEPGRNVMIVTYCEMAPRDAKHLLGVLTEKVMRESEEIMSELDKALDEDGFAARRDRAAELKELVDVYAGALGENLANLKAVAETVEKAAVIAAMSALGAMHGFMPAGAAS